MIKSHFCVDNFRCVFVDAGVATIDIETKRRKEEMNLNEARSRAVAEHGELALIAVDGPQTGTQEWISLRPPMLQVYFHTIYYEVLTTVKFTNSSPNEMNYSYAASLNLRSFTYEIL